MENLIRQARRRILAHRLFAEAAMAASAVLAALIPLLIFGTRMPGAPVAWAIPVAAALWGLYRVRRRVPSPYAVAQLVDRRLGLADRLSTALFFSRVDPGAPVAPEIRRAQFEEAERAAQSIDVRRAIPFTMPRAVYLMASLAFLAACLLALRFGLSRRLDLREPLADFLPESLAGGAPARPAGNRARNSQLPRTPGEGSTTADQNQENPASQDPHQASQTPGDSPADALARLDARSLPVPSAGERGLSEMALDDGDSEGESDGSPNGPQNQNGPRSDGKGGANPQPGGGPPGSQDASENSSLMNKLKDALQNLLSSVRPRPDQQGQGKQGRDQRAASGKTPSGSQPGGPEGQPRIGGSAGDTQQEGNGGQDAGKSENGRPGNSPAGSDSSSGHQPGGGMGTQDGDKAIHDAAQLAAMGKIGEILGKRSATLTGEATVEVRSTNQQLHTPYARREAQHAQAGAEINRDEIPVALQPYVQQYFEQVRKQYPTATKP